MINAPRRIGALAVAAAIVVAACGSSSSSSVPSGGSADPAANASGLKCVSGSITASGSTALQPLVDAAAKQYTAACSGATINVQGGGSGTGLSQVSQGVAQIGDSDVKAEDKLKPDEASQLVDHVVARQGWIMVTNKDVTGVTNLSKDQAKAIWTGQVTNWKDVGGPDEPIVLIIRPASSGTRATFKKLILDGANEATGQALTEDSNAAVTQTVEQTPGATSVIGFAYYADNKDKLDGLKLGGVDATVANISNGSYVLAADGHMYTKGQPSGLTAAFLDYMLSDAVQKTLIPSKNYGSVK